jgi:hypothetical protein
VKVIVFLVMMVQSGTKCEVYRVLGCDGAQSDTKLPTFREIRVCHIQAIIQSFHSELCSHIVNWFAH